jgi:hypothetical protein
MPDRGDVDGLECRANMHNNHRDPLLGPFSRPSQGGWKEHGALGRIFQGVRIAPQASRFAGVYAGVSNRDSLGHGYLTRKAGRPLPCSACRISPSAWEERHRFGYNMQCLMVRVHVELAHFSLSVDSLERNPRARARARTLKEAHVNQHDLH